MLLVDVVMTDRVILWWWPRQQQALFYLAKIQKTSMHFGLLMPVGESVGHWWVCGVFCCGVLLRSVAWLIRVWFVHGNHRIEPLLDGKGFPFGSEYTPPPSVPPEPQRRRTEAMSWLAPGSCSKSRSENIQTHVINTELLEFTFYCT